MTMCSKLEINDPTILGGFDRLPKLHSAWSKVVKQALADCPVDAEQALFTFQAGRFKRICIPMRRSLTPREKQAILDSMAVILGLKPIPEAQPA